MVQESYMPLDKFPSILILVSFFHTEQGAANVIVCRGNKLQKGFRLW